MIFALTVFLAMEIIGLSPPNQGVSPPDVKDFYVVLSKELEFEIDDCKTGFVGRVVDYQNPNDPNEFVRVYYRQVAIVSKQSCENNSVETGDLNRNSSNLNYHQKEEADTLGRAQKVTDVFAYVQWRTTKDLRTGEDIQDGYFKSGLLEQNENWTFSSQLNILTAPFSEPTKTNPNKRILVGIKFYLAGAVHIVRVDQDDIVAIAKEVVNDKK